MSQAQLGGVIGCTSATVSKYELEQRQLDPVTINALCDLFGVTSDYLLGRSTVPHSAVTDEDAELLRAFHAAPEHLQKAARTMLGLDDQAEKAKEKSEAS